MKRLLLDLSVQPEIDAPALAGVLDSARLLTAGFRAATVRERPSACRPPKRTKARAAGVVESTTRIARSTERFPSFIEQ